MVEDFSRLRIGIALTGSFCTIKSILTQINELVLTGANVLPIVSEAVYSMNTRFYESKKLINDLISITGNNVIHTIEEAETIGPKGLLDILAVAPCTSNTLGKIANGINDTPVTMAVKAHLRNNKPVLISISTNDGLSSSAPNIGMLLNRKNVYFVPFGQDDPDTKQRSLVADSNMILPAIIEAMAGRQLQPVLI